MSLFGKVEAEVEIKASANRFHETNSKRIAEIPKLSPNFIQSVDLVEGEWGQEGSVMNWYILYDGKAVLSKEVFETLDDKNHLVVYKVIGGILKEMYKSFKFILQAIPKGEGSLVRWTLEYEKLNADDPDASSMLQFCVGQSKDVDAHLGLE
ncbi:MLP-like protein 43 [Quercus lobata]|uniref:Bet v I/Major latex protein domain-containing protein n=1 Tax=Quercus lobata TaxID=97700 RepID=A0A7N2LMS6_QUELO|nr:MLP-like protein 43 [Quercus lobata]